MNESGRNPDDSFPDSQEAGQQPYDGRPDELHNLFAGTASEVEDDPLAALRNDPNYSALIRDLEYIATQARLLFEPAEQAPSDEVWKKIQDQLPTKLQD